MRLTDEELMLIDRHYIKFKLFKITIRVWSSSPRQVLEHVKELTKNRTCSAGCDRQYCTKYDGLNTD